MSQNKTPVTAGAREENKSDNSTIIIPQTATCLNPARITAEEVALRLDAKKLGDWWQARCPGHDDENPSLSFKSGNGGIIIFHCFAGCSTSRINEALGEKWPEYAKWYAGTQSSKVVSSRSYTLEDYSRQKKLPVDYLIDLGLSTITQKGISKVRIPYIDESGDETGVRYRQEGGRFSWRKGDKTTPYGLWQLKKIKVGHILLVEGESDAHTLWFYEIPALGFPGANTWKSDWAKYVNGLAVYIWQEPDQAGREFVARIGKDISDFRVIDPPQARKDISECHILGDDIKELISQLMLEARPWNEIEAENVRKEAEITKNIAHDLLYSPDILTEFEKLLSSLGLVGEVQNAKLLYLALTSRLLPKPVSIKVSGVSSSGKSFVTGMVLKAFPEGSYLDFTSMSPHALIYDERSIKHVFIILYEAAGLGQDKPGESNIMAYMVRSLLSEGRIKYTTVERGDEGMVARHIEREGPTGLITTTTWASLHEENETRTLTITIRDDREQTRAILNALALRANGTGVEVVNVERWHALQTWLEVAGSRSITIPYAKQIAMLSNPLAVRLRRDFSKILTLIQAHTMLHQHTRNHDEKGHIIANIDDYRAVYNLVNDIVSEGVEATVSQQIRETVAAVQILYKPGGKDGEPTEETVTQAQLQDRLALDKQAVKRRVKVALEQGFLINRHPKPGRGKPYLLAPGTPLPEEKHVIPCPEELERAMGATPLEPDVQVYHFTNPCDSALEPDRKTATQVVDAIVQPIWEGML